MSRLKFINRIHWKVIIIYLLLILIAMQVIGAYFNERLEAHYVNHFTSMLDQQANVFSYSAQRYMQNITGDEEGANEAQEDLQFLIERMFSSSTDMDIQVLDRNGIVISTTADQQYRVGQRNTQTEVTRALQGTREEAIRINQHNGHRVTVLALPVKVEEDVVGAVYLMASMEEMYQTVRDINHIFVTGMVIALGFTGLLGFMLARTISSPVKEMTRQAKKMAEGDFSEQVNVYGNDEIGQLAYSINHLSDELSQALADKEQEKRKLASILFHMKDGVVATDEHGRIILLNPAAEVMLDCQEADVLEMKIDTVLPVTEQMNDSTWLEDAGRHLVHVERGDESFIMQVNVSPLRSEADRTFGGGIIVLQDVTHEQHLERERKQFVANVSHELRTPLTTMKSYLETLESGALEDADLAKQFVAVISKETERMIRLVNDLLQLSKMDTKQVRVRLESTDVHRLLQNVAQRFSMTLEQAQIALDLHVPKRLPKVQMDRDQMTRVLDNILSNAIKYSREQSTITVRVKKQKHELWMVVEDEGIGIPKADLEHIFKRFYRVEKARSRDMGGTGLGLSIAREMIDAHHGTIEIDSDLGKGTTVTIRIPFVQQAKEAG